MKTFNSTVGAIGTGATISSFNLESTDSKKDLIKRMRKTLVPFTGKTIKSNKL